MRENICATHPFKFTCAAAKTGLVIQLSGEEAWDTIHMFVWMFVKRTCLENHIEVTKTPIRLTNCTPWKSHLYTEGVLTSTQHQFKEQKKGNYLQMSLNKWLFKIHAILHCIAQVGLRYGLKNFLTQRPKYFIEWCLSEVKLYISDWSQHIHSTKFHILNNLPNLTEFYFTWSLGIIQSILQNTVMSARVLNPCSGPKGRFLKFTEKWG